MSTSKQGESIYQERHRFGGFLTSDFSYFSLAREANRHSGGHPLRRRAEEEGGEVRGKLLSLGEALLPRLWRLLPDITLHVGGLGAGRLARSLFLAFYRRRAGHFARDLQLALELGEEGLRVLLRFGAARTAPELVSLRDRFFARLRADSAARSLLEDLLAQGFTLRSEGTRPLDINEYLSSGRGRIFRHRSRAEVIERGAALVEDLAEDIDRLFGLYRYALDAEEEPEAGLVDAFRAFASSRGFFFSEEVTVTLFASLLTRPLVILAGVSGTGKTKLAQLLAEFFCGPFAHNPRLAFVAVRPDWLDPRGLLGFHDLLHERYEATPFLELLLHAAEEKAPHFAILDEMNLARPEYFLADILSALESRRFDLSGRLVTQAAIPLHGAASELPIVDRSGKSRLVPRAIEVPPNVYIIGTINVDEASFSLSPRLYDRASVIELAPAPLGNYFSALSELREGALAPGASQLQREVFIRQGLYTGPTPLHAALAGRQEFLRVLERVHKLLEDAGAPLGVRSAREAISFAVHASALKGLPWRWALDRHLAIRVVPRLLAQLPLSLPAVKALLAFASGEEDTERLLEEEATDEWPYPATGRLLLGALRRERAEEGLS